jgi:hypothetical protein
VFIGTAISLGIKRRIQRQKTQSMGPVVIQASLKATFSFMVKLLALQAARKQATETDHNDHKKTCIH